jgi:signal transduction histidine kinase/ligand-binding sensor domain-containing protein/DNA-binding response OmpR family regulator
MNTNRLLTTLTFLFLTILIRQASAQPVCQFAHYSTEDGLPQYTIMDMIQDSKGFMWFATWDGISKFDGYGFRNYKVQPGDTYIMRSNRIERLFEDKRGNIWFKSYDGEAHCFDTGTETFHGIQPVEGLGNTTFNLRDLQVMPSGKVWILSEQSGCVCVLDEKYTSQAYNQNLGNLYGKCVYNVFEDKSGHSWLLTDNGLCVVPPKETKTIPYFFENRPNRDSEKQSFFAATEKQEEIWFGSGKGRIWKYRKTDGKFTLLQLNVNSNVIDFKTMKSGDILITTSHDGLFLYSRAAGTITAIVPANESIPSTETVSQTYLDRYQQVWFTTNRLGIYKLNLQNRILKHYEVKTEDETTNTYPPKCIFFEDKNGRLWIQPRGGGFSIYNAAADALEPFYNDAAAGNWKFSNLAHSAISDRQGNLWISSRSHGLEKIVFEKNYFSTRSVNPSENAVVANDVRAVLEDKDGNIWVSTKDKRMNVYDHNRRLLGRFSMNGDFRPDAMMPAVVYCMFQDKEGRIWMGTKGTGIILLLKNGKTWKTQNYRSDPANLYSLSEDKVYSIYQDTHGRIWAGTYDGGLNLIQFSKDGKVQFINHRNNLKNYPTETAGRVRFVTEDKRGHLCVGTLGGLVMFSLNFSAPENIRYHLYNRMPGNKESLSSNDVHGLCITKKDEMYLVTFGGGINKALEYDAEGFPTRFVSYTSRNGLPSDITLSIVEDNNGQLWVTTENNLTRLNPQTGVFETFAEIKRLMATHSFSEASDCRLKSGELVFGYSGGLLIFQPNRIRNNTYKPYLALTNFELFNKKVQIGDHSPLTENIDDIQKLVLKHKQNFFTIEYSALDYEEPDNIVYAYKLEGFDKDWQYAQQLRKANYTNIPHGHYIFKVKSTNSEGVWVNNERSLSIRVLPSFWQTWIAYLLYMLLFAGLAVLSGYILLTIYRLRGDVRLERKLSEMKLRFFTDISHEIRTPLTMITAPVEYMMNDENTPEEIRQKLNLVSHNTARMQRLVNQILDFRKIQSQQLKVEEVEFGPFVEALCSDFSELAEEQHIQFQFINQVPSEKIWVDKDALEKIVMNLLSNAFKYTPAGKHVRLILKKNDRYIDLSVQDDGPGIQKDKQKNLFTRFVSFNEDKSKPSTGIGLSMVKELAERHGAKVSVESEAGKGSCFTVSFQTGFSHFSNDVEIVYTPSTQNVTSQEPIESTTIAEKSVKSKKEDKQTVLIVEDDDELRNFLKIILKKNYLILEATDGLNGFEMAFREHPDFIVSDIMMPGMDGIELLKKLKENLETSHIPLVLLSAKTTLESRLEGMSYGADDYITKPFSVPYFEARIANLLKQRKRLQEIYSSGLTSGMQEFDPKPFLITSQDEKLMGSVVEAIENNMDNSEFTVEDLGQAVGMSRSSFFNKVKGLTGLSPVEFIRDIRLKRAAQLLTTGELLIKEVAYMTGFTDSRYFGECFKNKYGMTPAEFKKRQ